MKKYIKDYSQINESIGRGSVVLIKGKPEGGKKKLYAAHVLGTADISHGATMLFLSDDFYRIKEEDGNLRALKIGYRNEESLKSVLNLKSPGKISIVKNNNKTPFHWKTTKHTHINSALKDIEHELLKDSYIFEELKDPTEHDDMWNEFSTLVLKRTMNTLFLGKRQIDVLDYSMTEDVGEKAMESTESGYGRRESYSKVSWQVDCTVRLRGAEFQKYLDYFEYTDRESDVNFMLMSLVEINTQHDPGDRWTPPYSESEVGDIETEITESFVDGSDTGGGDVELLEIMRATDKVIATFLDEDLEKLIKKNCKNQLILRKKD